MRACAPACLVLQEQMEKVEGRMKELKAVLYAKFGSSINLEA